MYVTDEDGNRNSKFETLIPDMKETKNNFWRLPVLFS